MGQKVAVGGRRGKGGLVIGWLYLKGPTDLRLTWRYHLTRWRMERMRRRFDVHRGGKDDGPWVH